MNTSRTTVCIATFRRPKGLERALQSVLCQDCHNLVTLRVIVVNNDPQDNLPHEIVARLSRRTSVDIRCVDEPQRGPAHARNRALHEARSTCDHIAFLDDDEEAPTDWIRTLFLAKNEFAAAVVTGGVTPIFEEPPPCWATQGKFFARPIRKTGTQRPWAFTGNVLFDEALLSTIPIWFDARFTQGEDRHFFARLAATGARIIWCNEAQPREYVPVSRVHPAWLVQRMRNIGKSITAIERDTPQAHFAATRNIAKGAVWMLIGVTQRFLGGWTSEVRRIRGRMHFAYGVGLLEGAIGEGLSKSGSVGTSSTG